jgi:6-pyruvoyltetrahydropterin/6-carboxytetrahydropterin synthase
MSITSITKRYHFESAHFLPNVPEGHKCKRCHGHNYEIEVTVVGPTDPSGWVIDFWELDKYVHPLIDLVDHRLLNDIDGLHNPTAEIIARWFLQKINSEMLFYQDLPGKYPYVVQVRVFETKDCWATYTLDADANTGMRQYDITERETLP